VNDGKFGRANSDEITILSTIWLSRDFYILSYYIVKMFILIFLKGLLFCITVVFECCNLSANFTNKDLSKFMHLIDLLTI
jgi:hypothetical protein